MRSADQIATAPISWGVSEVPGWGYQLPAARVLAEMRALGFRATEAGPDDFLPSNGPELAETLSAVELKLVGGFTPLVLHDPAGGWRSALDTAIARFANADASTVVISADTGHAGYDTRPELRADDWARLLAALDEAVKRCHDAGLAASLHPHVGTVVERPEEIARVADGCTVPFCLDTGHVLVGGGDPVALARDLADRINHVHFKDVDAALAGRIRSGEITFSDAVRAGVFRPLGDGDVDIPAIVSALRDYTGWYVLEQDVMLSASPPDNAGPMVDVGRSRDYLAGLLTG
jgi:inosose dehydratase